MEKRPRISLATLLREARQLLGKIASKRPASPGRAADDTASSRAVHETRRDILAKLMVEFGGMERRRGEHG